MPPKGPQDTALGFQPWEGVPNRIALKGRPNAGPYQRTVKSDNVRGMQITTISALRPIPIRTRLQGEFVVRVLPRPEGLGCCLVRPSGDFVVVRAAATAVNRRGSMARTVSVTRPVHVTELLRPDMEPARQSSRRPSRTASASSPYIRASISPRDRLTDRWRL